MRRLIIFLIRKRLGLKKYEAFRFDNQKSLTDWYYFGNKYVYKVTTEVGLSSVSLNWLLNDDCGIVKVEGLRGCK